MSSVRPQGKGKMLERRLHSALILKVSRQEHGRMILGKTQAEANRNKMRCFSSAKAS